MALAIADITDETLKVKIQTSLLADHQKSELQTLLPQMTTSERQELARLIDDSVQQLIEADPKLQKQVQELNREYEKKLSGLLHEQGRMIRESFEKLEQGETAKTMTNLESEMEQAGASAAGTASPMSSRATAEGSKRKHPILKFSLALAGLAIVGILAFVIVNALS